jgi:hypothetical protein
MDGMTKTMLLAFTLAAGGLLAGCTPRTQPAPPKADSRVSAFAAINHDNTLVTVTDPRFTCQVGVNTFARATQASVDCGLTEQGRTAAFNRETIRINDDIELDVIPGATGPTFVAVNTFADATGVSVSAPGLHK